MVALHLLLVCLLPFAVGAVIGAALWVRARMSTQRAAAKALSRLRQQAEAENLEIVRGKLSVRGEAVKHEGLRGQIGAATAWLSPGRGTWSKATSREEMMAAETLVIDEGKREVEIQTPVAVMAGSRVVWTGERLLGADSHASVAWACASEGDEVIAVGRVSEEVRDKASASDDYRRGSTRSVLAPARTGTAVELAAVTPPAVVLALRLLRTHPIVVLFFLASCYVPMAGLSHLNDIDCSDWCQDMGHCKIRPTWAVDGHQSAFWRTDDKQFSCAPTTDAHCRGSDNCRKHGWCTLHQGECTAVTRDDCVHLTDCLKHGWCTPKDGSCKPSGDDCRHTHECHEYGQCTPKDGECVVGIDADCAESRRCKEDGACGRVDDLTCGATSDSHCAETEDCALNARCRARNGKCVASDEACAASRECLLDGECKALDRSCVATKTSCAASAECAQFRRCGLVSSYDGERCDEDAGSCERSAACTVHGRCSKGGFCRPTSDEDCKHSERCEKLGECKRTKNACVKTCKETLDCRLMGRCTEVDGACVAESNEDCASSLNCVERGMCTAREGRCEVGPDDCKEGARCRFRGVCSLDGLTCNLTSDADCRQTEGCKAWGKCTFDDYRCVIAGDDCRGTRACRELGSCTADEGKCIADSDADCQASEVCERYGWCSTQIVEDFLGTTKRCFRAPPKKL